MRLRLPRWKKDSPILHSQLNAMAEAIERADAWAVDSGSGLQLAESQAGRVLSLAREDIRIVVLTKQLPAGDGASSWGHGQGQVALFTPGVGTGPGTSAVPAGAPVEEVYNLMNVTIGPGKTILAGRCDGWLFYLLTICANGGT